MYGRCRILFILYTQLSATTSYRVFFISSLLLKCCMTVWQFKDDLIHFSICRIITKNYFLQKQILLTFICHSWQILSKFNPAFDPSVVLDFLTTCVHLQKQWQCRDRHVPKHDSGNNQDVLDLSDPQVQKSLMPFRQVDTFTAIKLSVRVR